MELLRYTRWQHAVFRIVSQQLWLLETHWLNRTMICSRFPSGACPACFTDRRKLKGYAIAIQKLTSGELVEGLVELSGSVVEQLVRMGMDSSDCVGWTFTMEKLAPPRGWSVSSTAKVDVDCCPPGSLPQSLETLFGLPPACDEDLAPMILSDRDEWLKAHGRAIRGRLERSCRIGSHQIA